MLTGSIARLQSTRGFGFLRSDDGQEFFFHVSSLENSGAFNALVLGQRVRFEVEESSRGPRACSVSVEL